VALKINEIFGPAIQGEGSTAGCPAIFIRLSGCNMSCSFCDTSHQRAASASVDEIIKAVRDLDEHDNCKLVVITGGEPLLQTGHPLCDLMHSLVVNEYEVQIETNGTLNSFDALSYSKHVMCSPKVTFDKLGINKEMVTCWKLLFPYQFDPKPYIKFAKQFMKEQSKVSFYLQPVDGVEDSLQKTIDEVKRLGAPWRLGVQLHKIIGEK